MLEVFLRLCDFPKLLLNCSRRIILSLISSSNESFPSFSVTLYLSNCSKPPIADLFRSTSSCTRLFSAFSSSKAGSKISNKWSSKSRSRNIMFL